MRTCGTPKSVSITLMFVTKAQITLAPLMLLWPYRDGFGGALNTYWEAMNPIISEPLQINRESLRAYATRTLDSIEPVA